MKVTFLTKFLISHSVINIPSLDNVLVRSWVITSVNLLYSVMFGLLFPYQINIQYISSDKHTVICSITRPIPHRTSDNMGHLYIFFYIQLLSW